MPKISELPSTSSPTTADSLPIVQGSTTKKTTLNDLPVPAAVQTALNTKTTNSAAAITGGTITGITDLAVADGGTGASTAAQARTNLGATSIGSSLFTAASANIARSTVDSGLPAFSAVPATATSLTSGVATKVTFATEVYDLGSAYDAANSKWVPGVLGIAHVGAGIRLSATATLFLYIYVNGVLYKEIGVAAQTSNQQSSGWADVQITNVNDYIEVYALQSSATQNSSTVAASTWFQGHMVRVA